MKSLFLIQFVLLLGFITWMIFFGMNNKTQAIHFIPENTELDTNNIRVISYSDGIENDFSFEFYEDTEALIERDTIKARLFAGSFGGYALNLIIADGKYKTTLYEFTCRPSTRNLRIIRQKLELKPYDLRKDERLKGNYYCTARYFDEDSYLDSVIIKGFFDLELVEYL